MFRVHWSFASPLLRLTAAAFVLWISETHVVQAQVDPDIHVAGDDVLLNTSTSGNITFLSNAPLPEYTGKLLVQPDAVFMAGNLTLNRSGEIVFFNAEEGYNAVLMAAPGAVLALNDNTLTMTSSGRSSMMSVILNNGYGDTTGSIVCGSPSATALADQITLVLNHVGSTTPVEMNFELYGGALVVNNPADLENSVSTFTAKNYASLILSHCPGHTTTTVGSNFTYVVSSISPTVGTASGGAIIMGFGSEAIAQNVEYLGKIHYSNTNYQDIAGNYWGHAIMLMGTGTFSYDDAAFNGGTTASTTDSIALSADASVPGSGTTLKVSAANNIANLPLNIGFCGGTLDVSDACPPEAECETVDLTGHNMAGIRLTDAMGKPFEGGGTIVVDKDNNVTLMFDGTRLKTDNGILKITTTDGSTNNRIAIVIDCGHGAVKPSDFAGLQLPANATVSFIHVGASDSVATGNLSGSGTVDAGNRVLKIGSNVSTTQATAFTGTISNATALDKEGTGTTYLGDGSTVSVDSATVRQGNLAVESGANFTVAGTLSVGNAASLSGDGTIDGNVAVNPGGWLCPGNSINTHATSGNLAIHSGGGIQIETVGLAAGKTTAAAGEDNDVELVGGKLSFQNGGKILVAQDGSSVHRYKSGDKYYAMVATQGIENIAGAAVSDDISGAAVNRYGVEYATINVSGYGNVTGYWFWFDVIRGFHATTTNGRNVSNSLVALHDAGLLGEVYDAVDSLDSDDQAFALQSLSGEPLASSQSVSLGAEMVKMNVLLNHIRPGLGDRRTSSLAGSFSDAGSHIRQVSFVNVPDECPWIGWFAGYGAGGAFHASKETVSTGVNSAGVLCAVERNLDGDNRFGFYYNYGRSGGLQTAYSAYTSVDDHFFGVYLTKHFEPFYWVSTFGAGADNYDARRLVSVNEIREIGRAKFSGWQSEVYNELGVELKSKHFSLQPFAGLNYVYLRENGGTENRTFAQYTALETDASNFNALRTHLGGRISGTLNRGRVVSFAELRAAWIHELLHDTAPIVDARFGAAANNAAFAVVGADMGRDWCWLGTGLSWQLARRVGFYTDYDLLVNACHTIHIGSGGLTFAW